MAGTDSPSRMSRDELLLVLVISLGSFMAGLDATIVNIALPGIAAFFQAPTVLAAWVLNGYLVVMVSLLLFSARVGDVRGYRPVFLAGFLVFTTGSVLCGLAPSIEHLIAFRMVQAIGGAIISALGAVMVTRHLGAGVRGSALGLVAMFAMLGIALGPVIGGYLVSLLSWRSIFLVNLPVGLAGILFGAAYIPRDRPATPRGRMDLPGAVLLFFTLGSLVIGLNTLQGGRELRGAAVLLVSLLILGLFVGRERKTPSPLLELSLFTDRSFTVQNVAVLALQGVVAGVMLLLPFYLEVVRAIPTGTSGALLLALPVGNILSAPIAGRFSDTIGTKRPILAGLLTTVIGLLLLGMLTPASPIAGVVLYLFLVGAGTGMSFAPLNSAVMGEVPGEARGAASGLLRTMANLGSTLGVSLTMLIATAALGPKLAEVTAHLLPPSELMGAFRTVFLCGAAVLILVLVLVRIAARDVVPDPSVPDGTIV
ncbi:MAG TPA: DHA2 family efflux MFS transporter permease subunit [Methanoregulaceae archaeon]|nr:DHA2 family efflux MFS transporter permease subunit [Methanoregulaceae archaeon]